MTMGGTQLNFSNTPNGRSKSSILLIRKLKHLDRYPELV